MTEYACPYCGTNRKKTGQLFTNWQSVVMHTAHCTHNDHHWIITASHGPIHSSHYVILSTDEFEAQFPGVSRSQGIKKLREYGIVDHTFSMCKSVDEQREELRAWLRVWIKTNGFIPRARDCDAQTRGRVTRLFNSWSQFLAHCGIETGRPQPQEPKPLPQNKPRDERKRAARPSQARWNRTNTALALRALYRELGSIRAHDCYHRHSVPSPRTINRLFGSWSQALEESGLPTQHTAPGRGVPTCAGDGVTYRSRFEAEFVNRFLLGRYTYEYECAYPNGQWLYDFYVPELDVYIELDGGLRPERMKEKMRVNRELNRRFLVIAYTPRFTQTCLEDFLLEECS